MIDFRNKTPFERFGIECGEGWKELYQPIIDFIENYNKEHYGTGSFLEIHQIKEKFGGLRFYWGGENIDKETINTLTKMIQEAENKSYKVCEECGTRENVGITVDGWYITLCRKCIEEITKKRGVRNRKWKCNGEIYIIKHE